MRAGVPILLIFIFHSETLNVQIIYIFYFIYSFLPSLIVSILTIMILKMGIHILHDGFSDESGIAAIGITIGGIKINSTWISLHPKYCTRYDYKLGMVLWLVSLIKSYYT